MPGYLNHLKTTTKTFISPFLVLLKELEVGLSNHSYFSHFSQYLLFTLTLFSSGPFTFKQLWLQHWIIPKNILLLTQSLTSYKLSKERIPAQRMKQDDERLGKFTALLSILWIPRILWIVRMRIAWKWENGKKCNKKKRNLNKGTIQYCVMHCTSQGRCNQAPQELHQF